MTFFSRCEPSEFAEPGPRTAARRHTRSIGAGVTRRALLGFAEDLGILVRYALGLDYYDRGALNRRVGP